MTTEEIEEVLNCLSLKQFEQLINEAMREVLNDIPTAKLIHALTPERQRVIGIVDGNELISDWIPFNKADDLKLKQRTILNCWCDAKSQLMWTKQYPVVGRA